MNFHYYVKSIVFFLLVLFSVQLAKAQENLVPDEALAPVKINGRWGYIDKTGKLIIPARYNEAGVFTEGKAPVRVSTFWGFIDKKGNWALKPVFTHATNFSNKKALISLFDPHDSMSVTGYITNLGEFLYAVAEYEVGYDYHDQLVRIQSADNMGMAFGYRDTTGKFSIEPRFDGAMDFSEGLAAIMLGSKWGYIDANNNYVLFPTYDEAYSFHDGLAFVRTGKKKGFINRKGKMVVNLSSYDAASPFMYENMVGIIKNGKTGFVNRKGKLVIKPLYDNPYPGNFNDSMAAVAVKSPEGEIKWGYINMRGEMVIPAVYDEAHTFYEGRARIKQNGKYGFIDKTGKIIAEPIYEDANDFTATYF